MGNQANLLQSLGWAVLNSLWQLALLWVIYQAVVAILPKAHPATKSILAAVLLMTGFSWFLFTFFQVFAAGNIEKEAVTAGLLTAGDENALGQWLQRTLPIASVIYLVLLVFPVLRFIRNYRYVQAIRRFGLSKMQADWRLFVNKTAARMGIQKKVTAWVSDLVSSPVTIGFWKPVILVPMAAINHLTPQQMEAVLLHELSHIRRGDYLVNFIINLIQTLLYFNPFAKAFVKIVEREREKSCDEMVLQFQYDSHEYASALLALEKASHTRKPLAIAAAGKRNDLLHRVEIILGVQHKPVITFNKLAGLFAGLLCIIALNALLIVNRPSVQGFQSAFEGITSPGQLLYTGENYGQDAAYVLPVSGEPGALSPMAADTNGRVAMEINSSPILINPNIINVSFDPATAVPQLSEQEEQQVQEALAASKKVLEEAQWKNVEKEVADVFSRKEKEKLKAAYEKELARLDWKSWENKLRQAYDKVNWDQVNTQLHNAVTMVRLDSLQQVYTDAINRIDLARTEMAESNQSGIPDSDITLKDLEQKRKELLNMTRYLKGIRTKKIVRL